MAVSGLVKDLAYKNQWFTGGQPYNVGHVFRFCYI